jgi:hypothetical protein
MKIFTEPGITYVKSVTVESCVPTYLIYTDYTPKLADK